MAFFGSETPALREDKVARLHIVGALKREHYLDAERVLDAAARSASQDIWHIAPADCAAITRLLDLHEQQLRSAPVFAVDEAHSRVVHFGRSDKRSPW